MQQSFDFVSVRSWFDQEDKTLGSSQATTRLPALCQCESMHQDS